ncbi:MAG: hypothetical protein PHG91_14210 [Syntrophales bacterium]|nr:hypothetical protein [Syntrophales bacterium]
MSESTMLWILGGMQAVTLFIVGWIKVDISELWKRANTHGHQIDCAATDCKPKTTAVILHEVGK